MRAASLVSSRLLASMTKATQWYYLIIAERSRALVYTVTEMAATVQLRGRCCGPETTF